MVWVELGILVIALVAAFWWLAKRSDDADEDLRVDERGPHQRPRHLRDLQQGPPPLARCPSAQRVRRSPAGGCRAYFVFLFLVGIGPGSTLDVAAVAF